MRGIVQVLLLAMVVGLNSTTTANGWQVVILNGGGESPAVTLESVALDEPSQPPDQATPAVTMRKVIGPDGKETEISIPEGSPLPHGFKPVDGSTPNKPEAGKNGKPGADAATAGPPTPVQRPSTPPAPPDRKELQVTPDDEGMVQFAFRNQSWPDLLKWLADVSHMSLDWQELPGDFVNIATQRKYTLEETRDLFNRHLLARGFTMIELDGGITVTKTDKINPALVPKFEPEELSSLPANRFVRTTFSLASLIAEEVIEEFNSIKSPNGKLTALAATNRIEAMDTAINLREINRILNDEQSEKALANLAREFVLEHVRAIDVKDHLEQFLGVKKSTGGAMSPEQMAMMQQQQQMQMQMQMQQQQAGGAQPKAKKKAGDGGDVNIAANSRQNSLVVHAPPDKMALIASFIKRWDVPTSSEQNLNAIQSRVKVFRLTSLDPERLVTSLREMDVLEPSTRLEVDKDNNAIIAYASLVDQYTIQQMITRLDGSVREFAVIQLRRLDAEEVAGTIKSMMVTPEKKDNNQNRYRYWDPWGNQDSKKKNEDEFRVGANTRDNQLLLWANEKELEEVNKFLVKLGEIPPAGSQISPIRTIDAARSPETYEYLKKIQEQWQRMSPNPIILPDAKLFQPAQPAVTPKDKPKESATPNAEPKPAADATSDPITSLLGRNPAIVRFSSASALDENGAAKPSSNLDDENKTKIGDPSDPTKPINPDSAFDPQASPIRISLDARGNLVLYSDDAEALDRLESLMRQIAPPKRPYEIFHLKYARPSWIRLNLQDYFKDKEEKDDNPFGFLFFDFPPQDKKKDDRNLSKKSSMRFVDDNDTKTLIVQGADDDTLQTIRDLIELWDKPTDDLNKKARYTKLVKVNYSQADAIVEAIKDAYRDLLSSNDKSFQQEGEKKENKRDGSDSISSGGAMNFGGFSGKLSLGVDRVTNSIIVFAEGEDLLKLVIKLIDDLDQAAKPSGSVEVVKLDGGMNSKNLEKALKAMLESSRKPKDPNQQQQQQLQEQQQQQAAEQAAAFEGAQGGGRRRK